MPNQHYETVMLWLHGVEIFIMIFGVALPAVWGVVRLATLLKDFPLQ